jgi:long-chain acyl-CoA synthetase
MSSNLAPRVSSHSAPSMRMESHFGDRMVRCFADRPKTITEMLDAAAKHNPHGIALVSGEQRWSYSEFVARVERLAAALQRRGLTAGERIALFLENGLEFPLFLFAAARLGAIAVPLSHRLQRPEVGFILEQSGATQLIYHERLGAQVPDAASLSLSVQYISVGDSSLAPESLEQLSTGDGELLEGETVGEEDVALLVYTSGTTGSPKGAMVTHLNLVHAAMTYENCMLLTSSDRSIAAVPLSHITGIAALLMTCVRCSSTLILSPPFKAADFLSLAAQERMTHTVMVPAMYNLCLLQKGFDWRRLSSWKVGGFGGAPMPPATIASLARNLPGLSLMNCYGATESVAPVAIMPPHETAQWPDRVGRVIPCADIVVVDEAGVEVPKGESGELWIGGATVVRGYWRDGAATAREFTGGFWHSGDLGSIGPQGHVGVHDRKKDMINRGGYKVFTAEVEGVLSQHPAVIECAVVAKPCAVLGERVHAFVCLSPDATIDPNALQAFCSPRLAEYKVPESFSLLHNPLPRNVNGKVLKKELRQQVIDDLGLAAS